MMKIIKLTLAVWGGRYTGFRYCLRWAGNYGQSIKCDTSRSCLSFRGGINRECEMSCVRLILVALLFCCAIRVEAGDDTAKCNRKVIEKLEILSAG